MARETTVEILGGPQLLRRMLAPPIRRCGLDTRIHSRRAIGRALPRTAVPTLVAFEDATAAAGAISAEAACDGEEPERRRR